MERMSWDEWVAFQERFPALSRRFAKQPPRQAPAPPAPAPPRYDTRPARARRAWTEEEDRILANHWGTTLPRIAKLLDRSPDALRARAEKLGLGPPRHGLEAITLRRFAAMSGFSTTKIRHAAGALGIKLRHAPAGRPRRRRAKSKVYAVTPGQTERILALMLEGGFIGRSRSWDGREPPACVVCGGTDRPHKAKGACSRCYSTAATRKARGLRRSNVGPPADRVHEDEEVRGQLLELEPGVARGDLEGDGSPGGEPEL